MAWAEVADIAKWDVGPTALITAYRKPLSPSECGLFSCLSVFHRNPLISPPQHPSLQGSCPLSILIHHHRVMGLEKQICWLNQSTGSNSEYVDMTKREKWPFGRSFHQNGHFIWIPSSVITQENAARASTEVGTCTAVGFGWKLELLSHDFIKVLTAKQVFLQLDNYQHIYGTAYAGISAGISCFGPVSSLWLAVWSRPTARLWIYVS